MDPQLLGESPDLSTALGNAGFVRDEQQPGAWSGRGGVRIDPFMVPELFAGKGSRGADLGVHGRMAARRAKGLEASLIDNSKMTVESLDPEVSRQMDLQVAESWGVACRKDPQDC